MAAVGVDEEVDLSGAWVLPGLMDVHVHLTANLGYRRQVLWKEVFRHQRRQDGDAVYWDEGRPSYATSGNKGLYGAMLNLQGEPYDGQRESVKRRMTSGNSFVSIVEFTRHGPVARSIVAYGNSSRPASPHWDDQAGMFARGEMKPVLFRMQDILANLEES